jgi:hypothetical protein
MQVLRSDVAAEEAIDQRVGIEIVDGRHTNSRKELTALHALERRVAGAVAQLNPGNAARAESSRPTPSARSVMVQRLANGGRAARRTGGRGWGGTMPVLWFYPSSPRRWVPILPGFLAPLASSRQSTAKPRRGIGRYNPAPGLTPGKRAG